MGITPGIIAGGLSLAGGLEGLFGGDKAGNVQLPPQQTLNLGGITSNLNSSIPQLGQFNLGGQNYGQYANILQGNVNNPYGNMGVQQALGFAPYGGMVGGNALGTSGALTSGAGSIINTAFDPQGQLYQRTADQASSQSLAALSGAGLAGTPWGQGVYGTNMNNFNIDWQNAQLNRQATGLGAAEGAGRTALELGSQGPQAGVNISMLPYNTYNQITSNQLAALTGGAGYGQQAAAVPQMGIGDWLQYLSGANQANSVANNQAQLALQQQQQQFQQSQVYGNEIGQGLSGLMGGNSPFNPFSSSPSYGGGNAFSGDAYGGSAFNPLPGLSSLDYG